MLSTFGHMFAPRHQRTAQEMARVCRRGGTIVIATWTPEGVFGDLSKAAAPYLPPPPDYASPPALWGREDHVRELFSDVATDFEFESSSGLSLAADPLRDGPFDTVLVSGGEIIRSMAAAEQIVAWLKSVTARRIASVCSGAFLLAEAGLLDGKRATTHWDSTERFERSYPKVTLDAERIFIRDGNIWTSAMSPRNFSRAFMAETGTTPAKAVERLRLEIARTAVETGHDSFERIAESTGFGDPGRMRRAFLRGLGQPPQALRRARA